MHLKVKYLSLHSAAAPWQHNRHGAQGQQAANTATAGAERMVANMPDSAVKVDEAQVCGRFSVWVPTFLACPPSSLMHHL